MSEWKLRKSTDDNEREQLNRILAQVYLAIQAGSGGGSGSGEWDLDGGDANGNGASFDFDGGGASWDFVLDATLLLTGQLLLLY